jgi:hypothetical protein
MPDQGVGVVGAEQVGPADRAVQQRPAGEDRHPLAAGFEGVGQVGEGVPGGGQDAYPHGVADSQQVAVADAGAVEGDGVVGVDVVGRAGRRGEGVPAGDVVVVDVGLEDVGDPDALGGGEGEDPVDVSLRVDDERDPAVVDQVAAVTQGRGVDRQDGGTSAVTGGEHRWIDFRHLALLPLDCIPPGVPVIHGSAYPPG